jgi:hypothetical protein
MASFGFSTNKFKSMTQDNSPKGIHLTPEDMDSDGIEVIAIYGTAVGEKVDWDRERSFKVNVLIDEKTGETIMKHSFISDYEEMEYTMRGYDKETNTWWVHQEDVDPFCITRDLCMRVVRKEKAKESPKGIVLKAEDTGTEGIKVEAIFGECFGNEIMWFDTATIQVVVRNDPVTGGPILDWWDPSREEKYVHQKGGFEVATNTWWRYEEEVNPSTYREHCMRILKRI